MLSLPYTKKAWQLMCRQRLQMKYAVILTAQA